MSEGTRHGGWGRTWLALLGVLAGVVVWWALPAEVSSAGRCVAGIGVLMGVWWLTEAVPIEVTGLVPLVGFPLTGALSIEKAAAPYADRVICLFLGGMLLGLAMERWGLHRRFALWVLSCVGSSQSRLVGAFLLATAAVSMFVSNAAATVMMLPIGASVAGWVAEEAGGAEGNGKGKAGRAFGAAVVLAIAFGASIGGVGTVIGTPPIAQYVGHMSKEGRAITFAEWLVVGLPVMLVVLPLAWVVLTRVAMRVGRGEMAGVSARVAEVRRGEGRMTRAQWLVLGVFGAAATVWVLGSWHGVDDAVVAATAALLLFLLTVKQEGGGRRALLTWEEAARAPWGILILFGGGLSLANGIKQTGVDVLIAGGAEGLAGYPLLVVLWVVAFATILLTEFTSNTALVAVGLPVGEALAAKLGVPPAAVLTTLTLTASLGFMLPAGTAPNALVFASGRVSTRQMMRAGCALDVVCAALVPLLVVGLLKLGWLPGVA